MPEPDANQPAESLRQAPTDDARGSGSDADVWRARYEALEGTIPVRLMHRYGAWVERVAPTGKLRRRLYERVAGVVRRVAVPPEADRGEDRVVAPPPPAVDVVPPATVPVLPTTPQPDVSIVIP